jgi:hypothetical protein
MTKMTKTTNDGRENQVHENELRGTRHLGVGGGGAVTSALGQMPKRLTGEARAVAGLQ